MADVRVALLGYGMAGREIHAPLLRDAPGVRLTHVVTGNAERAAAAAEDNPGVHVVASPAELWQYSGALDLVVVASPTGAHADNALAAIDLGIPVVVDKPLAVDGPTGDRIIAAADKRSVPLTVFQNRRWDSEHLTVRAVLGSGLLGEIIRYEARFERWRPIPKSRWRENVPSYDGGGLLMDLQSHLVDGALDLFGPVSSVYAELASLTTVGDDVAFLALRHHSGVVSHLSATSLAAAPGPRMRLLGRDATYLVAGGEGEPTAFAEWADREETQRGWLVRGEERDPVRRAPGSWGEFYPAVVEMLRGSAPAPVAPAEALEVLRVLDAARVSAAESRVVSLD